MKTKKAKRTSEVERWVAEGVRVDCVDGVGNRPLSEARPHSAPCRSPSRKDSVHTHFERSLEMTPPTPEGNFQPQSLFCGIIDNCGDYPQFFPVCLKYPEISIVSEKNAE